MAKARFSTSISVVFPALNEEDNIRKAAGDAAAFLDAAYETWEVLVVDDGSTDDTAAHVRTMTEVEPRIKLVSHPTNQGYGRAIASGFAAASSELVFFTDADNQFDIRELRDFMPLIEDHDAVFGFRVYRYDSVMRCILSWGYNRLVRVLFRVKVRDVDCAFKLFRREVVDKMTIESDDFFIDTELVARTAKLGCRSVEKGVRHYPRTAGTTTVRPGHIPRTLWTVARMWFRIHFPGKQKPALAEARAPR
ncbi:MAG: glycosyltransferase family 2 protein [Planctomycetota bacterium]